jgi:hypothetical protein
MRETTTKARRGRKKKRDHFDNRHVVIIDFPSSLILAMPREEQNLLLTFALAANEISALARLITVAGHQERESFLFDAFVDSQSLTLLKLYAGKIYETWELIRRRYFTTRLSAKYDARLYPEARAALRALKKYFASANIVSLLRHEGGFHYSRADVSEAFSSIEMCRLFLSGKHIQHELYRFADLAMLAHLADQISDDPQVAIQAINEDVASVGVLTHYFLMLILEQMFVSLTEGHEEKCAYGRIKVPVRKLKIASIPIFFDTTDYDEDLARFRKQLPRILKKARAPDRFKQIGFASTQHLVDYAGLRKTR